MDCHLVTIKVSVEACTDERMKLDGFSFHKRRFECLDSQPVKRGGTVQHNRMILDDILQDIPDARLKPFHHLLGILDIMADVSGYKLLHDERLEQLDCHLLRNTTLIDLHLRSDNNNGTAGIVDTLSEKVLTEASALSLQHIRKRLQRTVARAGDRAPSSAVVNQCVNGLLEHPLLVSHDDVRRPKLKQPLETVVSVDDSAVQIIQVGCRKTASIQLHHRAQIRRNNRDHGQNHPFRLVARLTERFRNFQPLDNLDLLLGSRILHLFLQPLAQVLKVDVLQKLHDSLRPHLCLEHMSAHIIRAESAL